MTTLTLPKTTPDAAAAALREVDDRRAQHLADTLEARRAPATRRVYGSLWRTFTAWAEERGHRALPAEPEPIAAYLDALLDAGAAVNTIKLARAAIRDHHVGAGLPDPTAEQIVRAVLEGALRRKARPPKQAKGLTRKRFKKIRKSGTCSPFDAALISTMRDALLRRSEAAALTWGDVEQVEDGTGRLMIRRSKTDQHGEGAVQYLSRATLRRLARIRPGDADAAASVFGLNAASIDRRIRASAQRAGLGEGYSGHSCRIGMAQDLAEAGISLPALMAAGRWKSAEAAVRYIRAVEAGRGGVAQYYEGKAG